MLRPQARERRKEPTERGDGVRSVRDPSSERTQRQAPDLVGNHAASLHLAEQLEHAGHAFVRSLELLGPPFGDPPARESLVHLIRKDDERVPELQVRSIVDPPGAAICAAREGVGCDGSGPARPGDGVEVHGHSAAHAAEERMNRTCQPAENRRTVDAIPVAGDHTSMAFAALASVNSPSLVRSRRAATLPLAAVDDTCRCTCRRRRHAEVAG